MSQIGGVIRAGTKGLEKLCCPAGVADSTENNRVEKGFVDEIGAGKGRQYSPVFEVVGGMEVDVLVTARRSCYVFSRSGESGRIQNNHIKMFVRLPQVGKGIGLDNGMVFR